MSSEWNFCVLVFYEEQQIKREVKGIHICGYRCNERLKAKTDGSMRLAYTGLQKPIFISYGYVWVRLKPIFFSSAGLVNSWSRGQRLHDTHVVCHKFSFIIQVDAVVCWKQRPQLAIISYTTRQRLCKITYWQMTCKVKCSDLACDLPVPDVERPNDV